MESDPSRPRYFEVTRKLSQVTIIGATGISLALVASFRGHWRAVGILAVAQLFLLIINTMLTERDRQREQLAREVAPRERVEPANPEPEVMTGVDLNEAIESALVIGAREYARVADLETEFAVLPLVTCSPVQMNQVCMNVVVDAAHAIEAVVGNSGARGKIKVSTRHDGDDVLVTISVRLPISARAADLGVLGGHLRALQASPAPAQAANAVDVTQLRGDAARVTA